MKNQIKRVITHGGQFHADEILALSLIRLMVPNIKIERKFKLSTKEYNDPSILIIDVGRFYSPEKGLFDHHQDKSLAASNLLVLDAYYLTIGRIAGFSPANAYRMYVYLVEHGFMYISSIDKGIIKEDGKTPTFNTLIRNINALEKEMSFEVALKIGELFIDSLLASLKLAILGEELWNKFEKVTEFVKLQEELDIIPNWKALAEEEGIMAIVQPNIRKGWQVVSRDTNKLVLPEDETATFRHNSGFLIVFDEKEKAKEYSKKLNNFYNASS